MLRLYNTLTRQEEPFAPSRDGVVRMYACGPTVYARAHIGNFRTYVCVDVLRRTLKHLCGYTMREAINYTDIDDKTITGAQGAAMPLREYTDQWIQAFREDSEQLGIEAPEETPRATDEPNLRAMGELIESLGRHGHTYTRDGSTYFKIATLPGYAAIIRAYEKENYFAGVWKPEYESLIAIPAGWTRHPDYARVAWDAALTTDMVFTQPVLYEFPLLRAPTLLIIGQRDRTAVGKAWAPDPAKAALGDYPALGRKAARAIPGARLVEVKDAGHLPQVEAFDEYIKAVLDFLGK